jgi:hypothetical protein
MSGIAYDPAVLQAWKENMPNIPALDFRPLPRGFYNIWRMLHVDGFERKLIFWFPRAPLGGNNEEKV